MTKYYRVRTQEQWDWLVSKLNVCRVEPIDYPMIVCHEQGRRNYSLIKYHKGPEPIIEVSQMMKESKMEDYVTIKSEDLDKIKFDRALEDGNSFVVKKVNIMGYDVGKYVRDVELPTDLLIPKSLLYPKVRMSVAEKKEFDELKSDWQVLICAFDAINEIDYPRWFSRLNDYPDDNNEHQLEFARAWADESLIEVIPEKKWNVYASKKYNLFWYKDDVKDVLSGVANLSHNKDSDQQFTQAEIEHYGLQDYERKEVSE